MMPIRPSPPDHQSEGTSSTAAHEKPGVGAEFDERERVGGDPTVRRTPRRAVPRRDRRVRAASGLAAELGKQIRRCRESTGLSQEDVARAADLSSIYIRNIEAGRSNPTIQSIEAIAIALGLNPAHIAQQLTNHDQPSEPDINILFQGEITRPTNIKHLFPQVGQPVARRLEEAIDKLVSPQVAQKTTGIPAMWYIHARDRKGLVHDISKVIYDERVDMSVFVATRSGDKSASVIFSITAPEPQLKRIENKLQQLGDRVRHGLWEVYYWLMETKHATSREVG